MRPVAKKLDRILVNDRWHMDFPHVMATFGSPDFSDHASLSLVLEPQVTRLHKPFRFYKFLLTNANFLPMIGHLWFSINVVGSAMFRVSKKLSKMKKLIRDFNKDNYSNLEKRVFEAHAQLLMRQNQMLSQPTLSNATDEMDATKKWKVLAESEEAFFHQQTSIN